MPAWLEWLVWASGGVLAAGTLWTKVVRPSYRAAKQADEMLPLLRDLTHTFRDTPHAFAVLDEIVGQFRTNAGSSLRDAVNRLETAATENKAATQVLSIAVETAKELAVRDREQIARLLVGLDRVTGKVDTSIAALLQIEQRAQVVADNLATAQAAVEGVAKDLSDSHERADNADDSAPGAAADAAMKPAPS